MAEIGKDIEKARDILKSGGLVGIPTETVYGLAGNAFDDESIARIFTVKNRPSFDPLIVHSHSREIARELVTSWPPFADQLAQQFWPGPLTLLLPKIKSIPDLATAGLPDVAIRVPDNPLTLLLLKSLPFPLVAPSANPFGYISPTTAQHVNQQLGDHIDYILDGGSCQVGIESTIIGVAENHPHIYRMGGLSLEDIERITGPVEIQSHSSSNPQAPGMLKSHYAPGKKLYLGQLDNLIKEHTGKKIGVLVYQKARPEIPLEQQRILAGDGRSETAARNLFGFLRELDEMDVEVILAERAPDKSLGKAINDRLKRASAE